MSTNDSSRLARSRYSRTLSYLLRHGAVKERLNIDEAGYVAVDEILKVPQLRGLTETELVKIVEENDKQRFGLARKNGNLYIRANQGHTIPVKDDALLELLTRSQLEGLMAIHGTSAKGDAWDNIMKEGLKCMSRNHIHMATGLPGDKGVVSGMRRDCATIIYIDLLKAYDDGIAFYKSANGVILTRGINGVLPPAYFKRVDVFSTGKFQQL